MPHKIFISYARCEGRDLALKLQRTLTAQGFNVWLDTSDIDGGASWSADIEEAIDTCDTLLMTSYLAFFRLSHIYGKLVDND
jgi:hypothetical protein